MPRDSSTGIYTIIPGTYGIPNTAIESKPYNTNLDDVALDLNTPRPIVAGGTGATSADGALDNISAEKFKQVVTNWDTMAWRAGSFYAAANAAGIAPVPGHAFAGIVYYANATDFVISATDLFDRTIFLRIMSDGVWGAWTSQSRQSIAAAPMDAMAFNGMQINGSMDISQENLSALVNFTNTAKHILDGWYVTTTGGTHQMTAGQRTASPPPGFTSYMQLSVNVTGNPSPQPTDDCRIGQSIEGYRMARLAWGTSNAQPIAIGFWVSAVRPGTYSGAVRNGAFPTTRSYIFTFTINAASTWEYKVVTIPGCTDGVWPKDAAAGMFLSFSMMVGATGQTAPGVWTVGNFTGATGTTNGVAAASDLMLLTGVVILPGSDAPTAARSSLIMKPYGEELLTCRRYYELLGRDLISGNASHIGAGHCTSTNSAYITIHYHTKRAAPLNITSAGSTGLQLYTATAAFTPLTTSITTIARGDKCAEIGCSAASVLVAGNATALFAQSGWVVVDARI
jgi:hypothetical protein